MKTHRNRESDTEWFFFNSLEGKRKQSHLDRKHEQFGCAKSYTYKGTSVSKKKTRLYAERIHKC